MSTKIQVFTVFTSALMIALGTTGCASYRAFAPADCTDFIKSVPGIDIQSKLEYLPFNQSWTNQDFDLKKYSRLYIAPVSTRHIKPENWVQSASAYITSEKSYQKEVSGLAEYFREQVIENLKNHEKNRLKIVSAPERGALSLELALTEVIFSHPAAYAGSMASPVPGTSSAVSASIGSSVAFEMRLRDAGSGKVIFTAADRRTPPAKILDLNKFTFTSSAREIVQEWAALFAKFLNMDKGEKIEANRFKVKPW